MKLVLPGEGGVALVAPGPGGVKGGPPGTGKRRVRSKDI